MLTHIFLNSCIAHTAACDLLHARPATTFMRIHTRTDIHVQFRSISYGLFGKEDYHKAVRRKAVKYMTEHKQDFEAFLGESFRSYMKEMAQTSSWGDELTLARAHACALSAQQHASALLPCWMQCNLQECAIHTSILLQTPK